MKSYFLLDERQNFFVLLHCCEIFEQALHSDKIEHFLDWCKTTIVPPATPSKNRQKKHQASKSVLCTRTVQIEKSTTLK